MKSILKLLISFYFVLGFTITASADPGFAIAVGNLILATAGISTPSLFIIAAVGYAANSGCSQSIDTLFKKANNKK